MFLLKKFPRISDTLTTAALPPAMLWRSRMIPSSAQLLEYTPDQLNDLAKNLTASNLRLNDLKTNSIKKSERLEKLTQEINSEQFEISETLKVIRKIQANGTTRTTNKRPLS